MHLRPCAGALALLSSLCGANLAGQSGGISYTVQTTIGGGTAVMQVRQDSMLGVAGGESEALITGVAVGGAVLRWEDDLGLLVPLVDVPEAVGTGLMFPSPFGGLGRVDSARVTESLKPGERQLAGHRAVRTMIRVDLWWHHIGDDGVATPVHSTGDAEWWSAPDLPYSALAVAGTTLGQMAALPLAGQHLDLAQALYHRIEPTLRGRGLLLRASVIDSLQVDPDAPLGGLDEAREVRVDSLAAIPAFDARVWLDRPRTTRAFFTALRYVQLMALEECAEALGTAGGSATWNGWGETPVTVAHAVTADGDRTVVVGSRSERALHCIHLVVPGAALSVGPHPVESLGSETGPNGLAIDADADGVRVLVLGRGTLHIGALDRDGMAGSLDGAGSVAVLRRQGPTSLMATDSVRLQFTAVPLPDEP